MVGLMPNGRTMPDILRETVEGYLMTIPDPPPFTDAQGVDDWVFTVNRHGLPVIQGRTAPHGEANIGGIVLDFRGYLVCVDGIWCRLGRHMRETDPKVVRSIVQEMELVCVGMREDVIVYPEDERDRAEMLSRPSLFGPGPWKPSQSLMASGFTVSEGWRPLLIDLLDELVAIVEREGITLRVQQIKQKLGGLRVYTHPYPPAVHEAIGRAESRAYQTCEMCGRPGTWRGDQAFLQTLCDEHAAARVQEEN